MTEFLRKRKRLTRYEMFVLLFFTWRRRLGLMKIDIERDNRANAHLITEFYEDGTIKIKYNSRRLAKWSYALLLSGLFHEIGHIKNNFPYNTEEEKIYSEYRAELYSLKMVKRYYPSKVPEIVAYTKSKLKNYKWKKENPVHHAAFSKIKDYQ